MGHILRSQDFKLELAPALVDDALGFPNNTLMQVSVRSAGFSGAACMEVDIREVAAFSLKLDELYERLQGEAKLTEPFGDMFLRFSGDGKGHIIIDGYLKNKGQTLTFSNALDQTEFAQFCRVMVKNYAEFYQ